MFLPLTLPVGMLKLPTMFTVKGRDDVVPLSISRMAGVYLFLQDAGEV